MSGRAIGSLLVVVILSVTLLLLQLGTPVPAPAQLSPPLAMIPAWLPVNLILVLGSTLFLGLAWRSLRRRPAVEGAVASAPAEPTLRDHGPVVRTEDEPPAPVLAIPAVGAMSAAVAEEPTAGVIEVVEETRLPSLTVGARAKVESQLSGLLEWIHGVSETLDHIAKAPSPSPTIRTKNGRAAPPPAPHAPKVVIGIEEPAPSKVRKTRTRAR